MTEKRGRGRPSIYTDELAEEICRRLQDGEMLKDICAEPGMPNRWTVNSWTKTKPEFAAMYQSAREAQADALADEMLAVGRNSIPETAAADKVRVNVLQWQAERLNRSIYGVKQEIAMRHSFSDLPDDELLSEAEKLARELGLK